MNEDVEVIFINIENLISQFQYEFNKTPNTLVVSVKEYCNMKNYYNNFVFGSSIQDEQIRCYGMEVKVVKEPDVLEVGFMIKNYKIEKE